MLGRLLRREVVERSAPFVVHASNGWWGWTAGSTVDAMRNAATWACVDVLASSVAQLPIDRVRAQEGQRIPLADPSLIREPSATVPLDVWLYQLMWSMLYDGNAFGKVTAVDARSVPTFIETLHPDIVTERKVVDGVVQAKVDGMVDRAFPFGDLWHVPGKMVVPGSPFGLSPVEHAQAAISSGLSAEDFGLRFFTDGAHPSSIIYADKDLTAEQARAVKQSYLAATRGNREPAVFGAGLKHEKVSVDPAESQFIELQRFTIEQVCRYFRVPPSMVYAATSGQNVTYANVSQADLHYLKHSLDGYLVRIERAISSLFPRQQHVRFNREALLRADTAGRYEAHAVALKHKWRTINEVRRLEDEEPFTDPEFDEPGIPGAAVPTAADPSPEAT